MLCTQADPLDAGYTHIQPNSAKGGQSWSHTGQPAGGDNTNNTRKTRRKHASAREPGNQRPKGQGRQRSMSSGRSGGGQRERFHELPPPLFISLFPSSLSLPPALPSFRPSESVPHAVVLPSAHRHTHTPGRTLEAMPPVTSVPLDAPRDPSMEGRVAGDISATQAPSAPNTPSVSPASSSHLIPVIITTVTSLVIFRTRHYITSF